MPHEDGKADSADAHGSIESRPATGHHPAEFDTEAVARRRRGQRLRVLGVVVGVALLTSLFGFGLTKDPTFLRSALIGHRAPDFALRTLDGKTAMKLRDLRGQIVVVNFWASWCAACRLEHPNLVAAWNRYRDQGVVFVGIVFEDTTSAASQFIREFGSDGPQLVDPGGRVAVNYGVYGIPETFFIGRDGVIAYKKVGPSSYPFLVGEINRLLAAKGS